MFNISLISKDKVVNLTLFFGISLWASMQLWCHNWQFIGLEELVATFCFITCKVLVAEWHDQHGWT